MVHADLSRPDFELEVELPVPDERKRKRPAARQNGKKEATSAIAKKNRDHKSRA
jgi:hypothetical protein